MKSIFVSEHNTFLAGRPRRSGRSLAPEGRWWSLSIRINPRSSAQAGVRPSRLIAAETSSGRRGAPVSHIPHLRVTFLNCELSLRSMPRPHAASGTCGPASGLVMGT